MKSSSTPFLMGLIRSLDLDPDLGHDYLVRQIRSILSGVRFMVDLEEIAKRYGLHYLQSKKLRRRELVRWILENHPAVKQAKKNS